MDDVSLVAARRARRGLTLTQPWASLVAAGAKAIETRSWATPYRGPLAIHAAKGLGAVGGKDGLRVLCDNPSFAEGLWGSDRPAHGDRHPADALPLGAIVATCELAHCLPIFGFDDELMPGPTARFGGWPDCDDDEDEEILAREGWWLDAGIPVMHPNQAPFGHFEEGRFAWFLSDVAELEKPVPCRGALGVWDVEAALGRESGSDG